MERENWERVGGRRAVEGNRLKWRMEESDMGGDRWKSEQWEVTVGEG